MFSSLIDQHYLAHRAKRGPRTVAGLAIAALLGVAAAIAAPPTAAPILAGNCGVAVACLGGSATSSLTVDHREWLTSNPVEPNDTDTWRVDLEWDSPYGVGNQICWCTSTTDTVYVDVTWSGSAWSARCTGCDATNGPVFGVNVCNSASCSGGGATHAWQYELILDIDAAIPMCTPIGASNWYLSTVEYTTTAVDDGNVVDTTDCSEGVSVSPNGGSCATGYACATDAGPFECPFTCQDAAGPSTTIYYSQ